MAINTIKDIDKDILSQLIPNDSGILGDSAIQLLTKDVEASDKEDALDKVLSQATDELLTQLATSFFAV